MSPFVINYYLFISVAGVFLLLFLSLLCYLKLESLKLKTDTENKCAINLMIVAMIYAILVGFLVYKKRTNEEPLPQ